MLVTAWPSLWCHSLERLSTKMFAPLVIILEEQQNSSLIISPRRLEMLFLVQNERCYVTLRYVITVCYHMDFFFFGLTFLSFIFFFPQDLVNTQELPSLLESALHKLKQVSEKYSSKSALGKCSMTVCCLKPSLVMGQLINLFLA